MKIVFLLEEPSMKDALDGILPRLIPGVNFQCIPHQGKQDLEKSIPRKLRGWREPDVHFVIVRDQDSSDCVVLKNHLHELCQKAGRPEALVRIACHELEAWFLGDLVAVETALGLSGLAKQQLNKRFCNPDNILNPAQELKKLVPRYQKGIGARRIGPHLNLINPGSHSLMVFLQGVKQIAQDYNKP
jgi:hypothetical protein